MLNQPKKYVAIGVIIFLASLSLVLTIWMNPVQALRMVFGAAFLLFLPGFFIIEIVFPRSAVPKPQKLDWIERAVLSFALSIAVVPLVVYFLNRAGVAITSLNIFFEVLGLIVVLGIAVVAIHWRAKRRNIMERILNSPQGVEK